MTEGTPERGEINFFTEVEVKEVYGKWTSRKNSWRQSLEEECWGRGKNTKERPQKWNL